MPKKSLKGLLDSVTVTTRSSNIMSGNVGSPNVGTPVVLLRSSDSLTLTQTLNFGTQKIQNSGGSAQSSNEWILTFKCQNSDCRNSECRNCACRNTGGEPSVVIKSIDNILKCFNLSPCMPWLLQIQNRGSIRGAR